MLETFLKKERRRRIALDLDDEEGRRAEATLRDKGKGRQQPHTIREVRTSQFPRFPLNSPTL
jgi:hypothetical protein